MGDAVDMAAEIEGENVAIGVSRARVPIAAGAAGECDDCGHYMLRLVDGRCGFCRDGRLPPDNWVPPVRPLNLPAKEPAMPAKSVQIPAFATVAIKAVEDRAAKEDISLGHATAQLIEAGLAALAASAGAAPADVAPIVDLGSIHVDALLDEVRRRFEGACRPDDLAAITERAEAAERRLAKLREVMAS